jgi:hypothetical protein
MIEEDWYEELIERLIIFFKLLLCLLIDSVFLLSWLLITAASEFTTGKLEVWIGTWYVFDEFSHVAISIFKYVLSISFLSTVIIYIVFDIGIMVKNYLKKFNGENHEK